MVHANFCDASLFSPFRRFTGGGRINPRRCLRLVNDYTLAFFQKELEGRPAPLLGGPSAEYPEVKLEIFSPSP